MNKTTLLLLAAACSLTTVSAQQGYEMGKSGDSNYDYLKNYKPLKQYVDRDKYPNFKLGCAIGVNDYANNSTVRNVTNNYFDETVAGNAMKMASCVNSNGDMNFGSVTNFVNSATAAGLNVYGHTLAWHSQQPVGWLGSLIKDKPAPELTTGDTLITNVVASKDFRTQQSIGWSSSTSDYGYSISYSSTDGMKVHTTKVCSNSWDVQFQAMNDLGLEIGKTYKMKMMIKGSKAGTLHTKVGNWNGGPTPNISFTTEWKEVEQDYKITHSTDMFLLQCGDFVGDIYIKTISFNNTKWALKKTDDHKCIVVRAGAKQSEAWDNQFWLVLGDFAANSTYTFSADVRADNAATASTQIHKAPGTYVHYEALGNVSFSTEWKTFTASGKLSQAGQSIAFNLNDYAGANNYYFSNISLKINGVEKIKNGKLTSTDMTSFKEKLNQGDIVSSTITDGYHYLWTPGATPLTAKEVHDTLVYAMDKWIKGMMNACGGKVKAWDLVNEAISGGGDDGQGNYTLQHRNGFVAGTWDVGGDGFWWQDYMGDLEYVRQACRLARKYGPSDVKLFINDYNLESDWDGNKKLKSLINWIRKWEADGVTKIDGIGTQMHISCYMNDGTMTSKKNAITNMFTLMAATGKLVRVSELDMGMVDASGKTVATKDMTETMHKKMADFYEWIYKEYFRLVPAAQQWGICQWCATDAAGNVGDSGGWRNGEPVGYWAQGYAYRKHAYAGVVRGLGGVVYTDIDQVDAIEEDKNTIYDLCGNRQQASFDELPAGLYIINGKKVLKKR